jgi:hypothetical protein
MPIQTFNISSGTNNYTRIPDDEDVTPVDRSLSKKFPKTERSFKLILIFGVVITCLAVVAVFGYHFNYIPFSNNTIKIYTTSKSDYFTTNNEFNPKTSYATFSSIDDLDDSECLMKENINDKWNCYTSKMNEKGENSILLIDSFIKYQKIIGFGGAFTEASAINYYKLPQDIRKRIMNLYFNKEIGIGLTLGRIHINSCDFSPISYNFDNVDGDYNLDYFDNEVTHDTIQIIPFILDAMEKVNNLKLVASPWSPPSWMKLPMKVGDNSSMIGSASPNCLKNEPKIKFAWAKYLSKFITAYENKGIPIWAMTPQNEPEFPAPWEACAMNDTFERSFIGEYLGPVIKSDHPDLLILAFDHNKDHLKTWTTTMFKDTAIVNEKEKDKDENATLTVADYVDGMAFHCKSFILLILSTCYPYLSVPPSSLFLLLSFFFFRRVWRNGSFNRWNIWL